MQYGEAKSILMKAAWANAKRPEAARVANGTHGISAGAYVQGRNDALRDLAEILLPDMEAGQRGDLVGEIEHEIIKTMTSRKL